MIKKTAKLFKYLNYVPKPVYLKEEFYDLVDDEEFCAIDGRIPLLILTQYGIFPVKKMYKQNREIDYHSLEGLENHQIIGLIYRAYISNREDKCIALLRINKDLIKDFRLKKYKLSVNELRKNMVKFGECRY